VLNVRGIKITPGEIYRVLQRLPQIRETMLVEQQSREAPPDQPGAERVEQQLVLLLVLRAGTTLNNALMAQVRRELGRRLSSAHVPDRIIAVDELPVTHSGKLSEAAARNAVNGLRVDNASALRNPGCLDAIRNHPALRPAMCDLPMARPAPGQLEALLRQQWELRFGFAPIGLDDNFFELGGNSLLAARLLADVQRATGRALPLATLLAAPTIRRLAELIERGDEPISTSPTLVPMREGAGAPLFLVHGLSGSVLECREMVTALQTARPVIGLQAPGLDGEELPPDRIEEIAARYVEQIRTAQPSGPYGLVGYSFGGLVVLEMAQQLRRGGESVDFLCLLDAYVHQDLNWSGRLRHRCQRVQRRLRELTARELLGYAGGKVAAATHRTHIGAVTPDRIDAEDSTITPAWQSVYERMSAAMAAYRPQPYDGGPMIHIRAAIQLGNYVDPMPLWRKIALKGLVVLEVPGKHLELVAANATAVAAALDQSLRQG
jgi:acetoacetyl-CoA synthetase